MKQSLTALVAFAALSAAALTRRGIFYTQDLSLLHTGHINWFDSKADYFGILVESPLFTRQTGLKVTYADGDWVWSVNSNDNGEFDYNSTSHTLHYDVFDGSSDGSGDLYTEQPNQGVLKFNSNKTTNSAPTRYYTKISLNSSSVYDASVSAVDNELFYCLTLYNNTGVMSLGSIDPSCKNVTLTTMATG